MGVIVALLMFNCNLHLNQNYCVNHHVKCINTLSSIRVNGVPSVTKDQRLSAAYLYCVDSGGDINDISNYISLLNAYENQAGNPGLDCGFDPKKK